MSGGQAPFRELFVELPRAVFEALQGIGEQAVREARKGAALFKAEPLLDTFAREANEIAAVAGWKHVMVIRSALDRHIGVQVLLACGHLHDFQIDELRLLRTPSAASAITDALFEHVNERSCYCVPRSP